MNRFFLFALLLSFVSPVLWAQEPKSYSKEELLSLYDEANKEYEEKKYKEALDKFELIYKQTSQVDMLFNIAQCQRFLGDFEASTASYSKYLNDQPGSDRRFAVEEVVVEMEQKIKERDRLLAARKTRLIVAGGLTLLSAGAGAGALLVANSAQTNGDQSQRLRLGGISLALSADIALVTAGVMTFMTIRKTKRGLEKVYYPTGVTSK